jgi:Transglycosylase-like domain
LRHSLSLSLLGLALLITFALAGAAVAETTARPAKPAPARALRSTIEHYRKLTWTYERAAHVRRSPSSSLYRRSTDGAYLDWAVDVWTRRADRARAAAVLHLRRKLAVALPASPGLRSRLSRRIAYARKLTLRLRRIFPGRVSRAYARGHAATGTATLKLWQERSARAALLADRYGEARRIVPRYLASAFTCIHHYEGAWDSNTGNGYYGGLQMDLRFQSRYGAAYLHRWGTADNWPAWAQLQAAVHAYRAGRGFYPWPNTARACGLI